MPIISTTLTSLIQNNIDSNMRTIGQSPLSMKDPSFYKAMCEAFGSGLTQSTPVIQVQTLDIGSMGAPPVPGFGSGIGIEIDTDVLAKSTYEYAVKDIINTGHSLSYPVPNSDTGAFLAAISKGLADAIGNHFLSCWTIVTSHPIVYSGSGKILPGMMSGVQQDLVKQCIMNIAPQMKGDFWPRLINAFSKAYVEAIHLKAKGKVNINGICIPAPGVLCGLPSTGAGQGTAA